MLTLSHAFKHPSEKPTSILSPVPTFHLPLLEILSKITLLSIFSVMADSLLGNSA